VWDSSYKNLRRRPIVSADHLGYIVHLRNFLTLINKVAAIEIHCMRLHGVNMIYSLKAVSALGMLAAIGWFFNQPDFAAVLLGILSLSVFMMTLLPVSADNKA
jgi:hypothetical protein